ncbi:hypothetical protein [Methanosarcina barkeri]|uniref:CRISPR type III-B/RAMP module-associated protein Cmr5 n=1 Tax=Methanosarcina barkeri CM1 TaxID=796385 RepID=A0A0G3CI56_METBA|nr:hypothetical protein [Methanosarcina barkeri]AKJ38797.1 hypothetical protein MCM1_1768 [Methanosarcina barkeri CM1]
MSIDPKDNLDFQAAKLSQQIIEETIKENLIDSSSVENLVTKTLGVLQENGVYACILYLQSRSSDNDKKISNSVMNNLFKMTELIKIKPPVDSSSTDKLSFVSDYICKDLDTLFLTKQLWEQILLYARYGAKAVKDGRL